MGRVRPFSAPEHAGSCGLPTLDSRLFFFKQTKILCFRCTNLFFLNCAPHGVPGARGGKKRKSDPLELEFRIVVNRHVGAGN